MSLFFVHPKHLEKLIGPEHNNKIQPIRLRSGLISSVISLGTYWKKSNMRNLVVALALFLFAAPTMTIADPVQQSGEMKVLNRWLGTWKSLAVIKPSNWFPGGKQRTETKNVEWVLGGHFQQATIRSNEHEARGIYRYDAQNKVYQSWFFDSEGNTSYWIGTWNEESKTMTWKLDFSVIKGTMVDRFVAADKYDTTIIMKDIAGNLLLYVQTEHTRVKKQAE
jgi:hypothetical protein